MFRTILTQVVPLLLAALGTIGLSFLSKPLWRWLGIIFWLLAVGLVLCLVFIDVREQQAVDAKTRRLTEVLLGEIDRASGIEYRMRGERDMERGFDHYVAEIETWRTRVENFLEGELPRTGASQRFAAGAGEVGRGPAVYEHTRLVHLRTNLLAILDNLPLYVSRSRASR